MKKYAYLSHIADIRMSVAGNSLSELFIAAVLGMNNILCPGLCDKSMEKKITITHEISITASDLTVLLVDFLSEILTYTYEERAAFCRIDFLHVSENLIKARIYGLKVQAFADDIKAVTYHEANVMKDESGIWRTIIIFDV